MNKDLISRQDAIKEVSKYVHSVDMIIGNGTLSMAGCRDTAEEILEGLPSMESEPKWIPCSERMPEEGQECLVYDKAVGFRVDTYMGRGNPYNWELFVRDYEAWMPIPKLTGVMLSE